MFGGYGTGGGGAKPCASPPACSKGDPVNLATGLYVYSKTDLSIPDVMPINITRTYRADDPNSRAFGIGSDLPFNWFFYSTNPWGETDVILPDGQRIRYNCRAGAVCTHWTSAILEHTATQTEFYGSVLFWNSNNGWDLQLKNGTVYRFTANGPLQEIRDKLGNRTIMTRANPGAPITRITSPNGRWVEFHLRRQQSDYPGHRQPGPHAYGSGVRSGVRSIIASLAILI